MKKIKINDRKILIIMLGLIIMLFAHNIYLQTQVKKAIDYASDAEWEARQAKSNASDAANYASDAADYASDASDYAQNAYYSAQDAANNSYGHQCWSCP